MQIQNQTRNTILAKNVRLADTFVSRMVGLLNKGKINSGEGLLITRCNSIHMFFMKFAIDAVFVDKKKAVVGLVENIKPFRLSRIYFKADSCLELPVGVIQETQTQIGDQLIIIP